MVTSTHTRGKKTQPRFPLNSIDSTFERWTTAYCIQVVENAIHRYRERYDREVFAMCLGNKVIQEGLKDFSGEVILCLMLVEKALASCSVGWIYFGGLRIFLPLYEWLLKRRSKLQSSVGILSYNSLKGSVLFLLLRHNFWSSGYGWFFVCVIVYQL